MPTDWGNINDYAQPAVAGAGKRIMASAEPNLFFKTYPAYVQHHLSQSKIAIAKGLPSLGSPLSKNAYWSAFRRNMGQMVESPVRRDVFRVLRSGKVPSSSNFYGPGQVGVQWRNPATGVRGFTPHAPKALRINPTALRGKSTARKFLGAGAALAGAKTLLGANAAAAFGVAPAASAALVAGAGAAGYGVGRGLNKLSGGAIDRAAQRVWQPLTDKWYGVDQPRNKDRGKFLRKR